MNHEKLVEFIKENYKYEDGRLTSMHSHGNGDDVFSDGVDLGWARALSEVAEIIGMAVEPLKEQETEDDE